MGCVARALDPARPEAYRPGVPPRTLHINTEPGWRGGEQQTLLLAAGLRKRGVEAEVAALPGSPMAERARAEGLRVHEIRMRSELGPRAILALRRVLRERPFDLVHAHTTHAHALGAAAARLAGGVAVVVARRVDFTIYKQPFAYWKYAFGVDRYVAISRAIRNVLIEDGLPPEKIALVHSGVDPDKWAGADPGPLRAELGIAPEDRVVANVAALVGHKDHETLVAAMPAVLAREPRALLLVAGDGKLQAAREAQARGLGVAGRVRFLGYRKDVGAILAAAELFVLSSQLEGLCTSILDAMSMRLAVIATRVGGIPEIVRDGENGLLVPVRDPAALADAIGEALADRALARRLAEAGRRTVEEAFSADAMVEGNLRVYREVWDARGLRP